MPQRVRPHDPGVDMLTSPRSLGLVFAYMPALFLATLDLFLFHYVPVSVYL